jgi:hypothetical protein
LSYKLEELAVSRGIKLPQRRTTFSNMARGFMHFYALSESQNVWKGFTVFKK